MHMQPEIVIICLGSGARLPFSVGELTRSLEECAIALHQARQGAKRVYETLRRGFRVTLRHRLMPQCISTVSRVATQATPPEVRQAFGW